VLPDPLAQWDILPASALNAILRTVVRHVAAYREAPRRQGLADRWARRRTGSRCCPCGRKTLGKGKYRGAASGRPGYLHRAAADVRVMITARHRNIALLVAGCYFMEMLDGTNIVVP
jgi:hypothetical protein